MPFAKTGGRDCAKLKRKLIESRAGISLLMRADYRRGFEAALHAKLRGRSYDEAAPELIVFYHEAGSNAAFRRG